MWKTISLAIFLSLIIGSTFLQAQQAWHPPKWETSNILDEYPIRGSHNYYEQNVMKNPSAFKIHSREKVRTLNAIIPDFLVNENGAPSGTDQLYPSISTDSSGNFVVTWYDSRNGDWDIYAQRYSSSGGPLGTNFKVNDDLGNAHQVDPSITARDNGNFIIAWVDYRNGDPDIYAQRYSSNGNALGTNFKVNDDPGIASQVCPSITNDGSGNFVITWEDYRNIYVWPDIYAQRYSSNGNTLGTNFKVNDDVGGAWQCFPSISADSNGNFVITWQDDRLGDYDIYSQRYFNDGSPLGTNFKVNDDLGGAKQYTPSVSVDGRSNFVITWGDDRNGDYDIYAQRYSSDCSTLGTNFKVSDDPGISWQVAPSISTESSANFVITWEDWRNGNDDIYAQRFFSDGSPLGNNFKVNDDQGSANQSYSSISLDFSGNFVITWEDYRNGGNGDIFAQRFFSDGSLLGSNFKINDDLGIADQMHPSISTDGVGNFVITWLDERNEYYGDIYAQRYSSVGSAIGLNFKVNDDPGGANQWYPSISSASNGIFTITWSDERNGDHNIYAQRYSSTGSILGTNFKVNDDSTSAIQLFPSISAASSGNFIITWQDERNGDRDIYARRYAADGSTLGANFKVNDDQGSSHQWYPSISCDSTGNFVITWIDGRNGDWDIYAQRFSNDGSLLGINFKVNDDLGSANQKYPAIATDGGGNFIITWKDERTEYYGDIYAQRYSRDGTALETNFKVNDDPGGANQWYPSISADGSGNFIISWQDSRNGDWDVYGQRFSSDGSAVDSNFRVTNTSLKNQYQPAVKLWKGRIYNTWTDNRAGGTGYDIWANVLDWNNPVGIFDEKLSHKPSEFVLNQNYPNPFNTHTTIKFTLPEKGQVSLHVYNTLGQTVRNFDLGYLDSGNHQIKWNSVDDSGNQVASGIYIYELKTSVYRHTKKMLLIR